MRSKDYDYNLPDDDYEISNERKEELIKKVKIQLRKGFIAHYQILEIGKNDNEYDFLYDWLDRNNIKIRGINGTVSGELPNYIHIPKMGQSYIPEVLDEQTQEKLFYELEQFNDDEKQNNSKYFEIRNKLIEGNMRLAIWITTWKGISQLPVSQKDKEQMAMIGLTKAVDKFDPSLGYKFSTYACKVIYRTIARECFFERNTRYSIVAGEQLAMMEEIENQMLVTLNRKPENYELADILGISEKKVMELKEIKRINENESLDEIDEQRSDFETVTSQLSDGDRLIQSVSGHIVDGIYIDENDTVPSGFRINEGISGKIYDDLSKVIGDLLEIKLNPREKDIMMKLFGFETGEPKTLEAVAREYGLHKETIRQIQLKALRKLRNPNVVKKIEVYLDHDDEMER